MNRTATLGEVLGSHELPFVVRELQGVLVAERERREKFYDWLTPSTKAEFINGEVIVHSPARLGHIDVTGRLFVLLRSFVKRHKLGLVTSEKALICLTRNDYEPDICFFGVAKEAMLGPDTLKFPVPDFIVEVLSESTEQRDRTVKMQDYALHGVAEYWIVDAEAECIEQRLLSGGRYGEPTVARSGTLKSPTIAGFELPVRAIFDEAEHERTLRAMLDG